MTFLPVSHARIKLQKRHLLEWDTLAVHQQLVLTLIHEAYAKKLSFCQADTKAFNDVKDRKTIHILKAINQQEEERHQMRRRHQQEKGLLEQVVDSFGQPSASDPM